jgi:hypothetical protein
LLRGLHHFLYFIHSCALNMYRCIGINITVVCTYVHKKVNQHQTSKRRCNSQPWAGVNICTAGVPYTHSWLIKGTHNMYIATCKWRKWWKYSQKAFAMLSGTTHMPKCICLTPT